ncbi:hypothetical protein K8R30_03930 [archaeon]|nr:hypothetical protein [archaeon]
MKKIFIIIGVVLMLGLVFAAESPGIHEPGTGLANPELMAQGSGQGGVNGTQLSNIGEGQKIQLQAGEHIGEDGQRMMIQTESNNQMRLEVGGESAKTSMKIDQEMTNGKTKLTTQLSNGKNAEIKVMPDVASNTALERLRLKTCSEENGCSIELKEVGAGDKASLAYEVKTERQSRFLGVFGAKMQVQAQVDAETGEVLDIKKPWWAILASEPAEE